MEMKNVESSGFVYCSTARFHPVILAIWACAI